MDSAPVIAPVPVIYKFRNDRDCPTRFTLVGLIKCQALAPMTVLPMIGTKTAGTSTSPSSL